MFCTECGKMIPNESKFCTECGAPAKSTAPTQPAAAPVSAVAPAQSAVQPIPVAPAPVSAAAPIQQNSYVQPSSNEQYSRCNNHLLMAMAGCFGIFGVHDYIAVRVVPGVVKDVLFVLTCVLAGATADTGAGAFVFALVFTALMVCVTIDCYMIACGGFKDGQGLRVKKTLWGLAFAIPMSITTFFLFIGAFALL